MCLHGDIHQQAAARGASAVPLFTLLMLLCLGRLRLDVVACGTPALLMLRLPLVVDAHLGVRLHLVVHFCVDQRAPHRRHPSAVAPESGQASHPCSVQRRLI